MILLFASFVTLITINFNKFISHAPGYQIWSINDIVNILNNSNLIYTPSTDQEISSHPKFYFYFSNLKEYFIKFKLKV